MVSESRRQKNDESDAHRIALPLRTGTTAAMEKLQDRTAQSGPAQSRRDR